MKFILAAVVSSAFVTTASADGLSFNGYTEYAFEEKTYEIGLGTSYAIDNWTVGTGITMVKPDGSDFEIDHVDVGISYDFNENVSAYTLFEFDKDLDHTESTVGMSFSF